MGPFQRVLDFYLDASFHVAFSALAMAQISLLLFGYEANVHLSFFVFFGTVACYNFVKYGVEAEKYIVVANAYHRSIQWVSLVALLLAGYHAFFLPFSAWVCMGAMGVLTGLYAIPIWPGKGNLRSLGLLKINMVALCWAITTVVLPLLVVGHSIGDFLVGLEAVQRYFLVLGLILPFEIRDLAYDSPALGTLPQRIGVGPTIGVGALLLVLFWVLSFFNTSWGSCGMTTKTIITFVVLLALYKSKGKQGPYFASFWVEGIPILWLLLMVVCAATFP